MAARGPKIPRPRISEKNHVFFFEIQRTIDTSMGSAALEIMHMVSTESLLARAVFTKSINVLGWQAGSPKSREHDFSKKNVLFLNFIGPVTPPWHL